MSIFKICKNDGVLSSIREAFDATPLKVPSTIEKPLFVFAKKSKKVYPRGDLHYLLEDGSSLDLAPKESPAADISGKKTRSINIDLGLELLGGMLKGFGLTAAAPLGVALKGAEEISFCFSDVRRRYISANRLGAAIKDLSLDLKNPALGFLGEKDMRFLVIDNIFVSKGFSVFIEKNKQSDFKIKIPLIEQACANINTQLKVMKHSEQHISFEGVEALTFAFTCLEIQYDKASGKITNIGRQLKDAYRDLESSRIAHTDLIADELGMLSWD